MSQRAVTETELEMVKRHVLEGERHLANQVELIDWLKERGYPTEIAERLLTNLEDMQRLHLEHLARLRRLSD